MNRTRGKLACAGAYSGSYGGREGHSRHVAATSGRCRADVAAMALRRRSDVGPMSGRCGCDGAATSLRRRADVGPMSLRWRCDVAPTSGRCRADGAATSLRCRCDGAATSPITHRPDGMSLSTALCTTSL